MLLQELSSKVQFCLVIVGLHDSGLSVDPSATGCLLPIVMLGLVSILAI